MRVLHLRKPPDETWIWFSSLGLSLGLLLVSGLLFVLLREGIGAFWPRDIWKVTYRDFNGETKMLWGELAREETHLIREPGKSPYSKKDLQFFVGNRDVFGQGFRFLPQEAVLSMEKAPGIWRLERWEYGAVLGKPERFMTEKEVLASGDILRNETFQEAWREAERFRRQVQRLEKQIGRLNERLRLLEFEKAKWPSEVRNGFRQKELQTKIEEIHGEYETLMKRLNRLREQKPTGQLHILLFDGSSRTVPLENIVGFCAPSSLNSVQKFLLFGKRFLLFLWEDPREANTEGGIFPALFGTFVMTLLLALAVTPFGVLAAIYLREYARQGFWVRLVRIAVNNLAGVPSIVFGVFGLGFFVYGAGGAIDTWFFPERLPTPTFGTGGILWASLTLALLTVPVVIVATEEALAAVPRGVREGALACGASRWQTVWNVVLPAAGPGILTGFVLAMARGAGEVAPLMLVGVVKLAPTLPVDGLFPFIHLERKFMHLGFYIYDLGFQSPDSEAAKPMVFAASLVLIGLVVLLNLGAIVIRDRLRKKYATGAF